jgi:hypothetical protein
MPPVSRRRFIPHAAHATIGVSAGRLAIEDEESASEVPAAGVRPLGGWMVSGPLEYHAEQTLAIRPEGDSPIFAGYAAKIGTVPVNGYEISDFSVRRGCSGKLE